MSPPILEKLVLSRVEQKESEFKRFPFYMEVYKYKLFTSGTLTCFSAQGSCFCKEHFTPRWQVGSQKSNYHIEESKRKNIIIWVPCEDSNLKQSAQIRWSQLDGGFRALHSVLVYILVPKRGAVKITHGELCEMIISGRLLWGFKPQIYRFCCQILYLLTFFKVVTQKQKRWVNDHKASNLRP